MKLSIIVPVYNEQETIQVFYNRLIGAIKKDFKNWKYEIIFIDDGSIDTSYQLLKKIHQKDKQTKILQFSRNFGHHIALSAGIDFTSGDIVVMMDGDLQDRPEEIIDLYKKLQKGFDVVYAQRIDKKFGVFKKLNSKLFNMFITYMIHDNIVINSTIFRITTKQVINEIKQMRESNRYLVGIIGWVGFSHASQPVMHGKRYAGVTKYSFQKQLQLALQAIFSHSTYPLTFFLKIGIIFFLLSGITFIDSLYSVFIFHQSIFSNEFLFTLVCFIGSIQIMILAIIGEYVGRMYIENKNRPLYIVKNKIL